VCSVEGIYMKVKVEPSVTLGGGEPIKEIQE
jgi:hypothetical protein